MKNKRFLGILVVMLVAAGVGGYFLRPYLSHSTSQDYKNIPDFSNEYNADAEIAEAMARFGNSKDQALVIGPISTKDRIVAITFDGLADPAEIEQLLALLKKYNMKATFFVDGLQAAEDPQSSIAIRQSGQKIENYTFSGFAKMETLSTGILLKEFCRAGKVIKIQTDQDTNILKCNNTKYTPLVRQAAKAAGFNAIVRNNVYYDTAKMTTPQLAEAFAAGIKPGSIISIKLSPTPDPIKNEAGKTNQRPAIDKQPGLRAVDAPAETDGVSVPQSVEFLLQALQKSNLATVNVEDFYRSSTPQTATQPAGQNFVTGFADSLWRLLGGHTAEAAAKLEDDTVAAPPIKGDAAEEISVKQEAAVPEEIKLVNTSEAALAYTFGGLSKPAEVDDVLSRLSDLGIRATFFVSEQEMRKYPDTINRILAAGHEIGLAFLPARNETMKGTVERIARGRQQLQDRFGVKTDLVRQSYGKILDTTRQAAAASGCRLIGQSLNVVQSKHKDYASAERVMSEIFKQSMISLERGSIVYFRMDFYNHSGMVGDLLAAIKQCKIDNIAYATTFDNPLTNNDNDSQYVIKPLGEIFRNEKCVYRYPVDIASVPASLRDDKRELGKNFNLIKMLSHRYIGNVDVTYEDRLLDFSPMETRRFDTTGLIHTKDNVIFLTFDDWGTDAALNKLLYVLRKHHVNGTFFILTHNILVNPNLLRAVAMDGNEVGCHSDMHKPMVVRNIKTGQQEGTQSRDEYVRELGIAFQKLRAVIGDVSVNGKPALTRLFRPPTLALSRMGAEAVFINGYDYIVSGSCSTYDYKTQTVAELVNTMKAGIYTKHGKVQPGAILTMHMGDACVYTPIALDILLTANELKSDSDPSKFKIGRLSDYLTDGYDELVR